MSLLPLVTMIATGFSFLRNRPSPWKRRLQCSECRRGASTPPSGVVGHPFRFCDVDDEFLSQPVASPHVVGFELSRGIHQHVGPSA